MSETPAENIPAGYRFAAAYAGIRKKEKDDVALLLSEREAAAAGVFTTNAVKAAPVILSARHLRKSGGRARAIVVNAGNANCATPTMDKAARRTARAVSKLLAASQEQILVASTGVIGEPLEEKKITRSLDALLEKASPGSFEAAAAAIMTTDTAAKTAYRRIETPEGEIRLAGMAKGAGMIQPNMATMLAFVFTDAGVKPKALDRLLRAAVESSFHRLSVDSDTSTNDTVLLLANGASGIRLRRRYGEDFEAALRELCEDLAIQIARDGEGATKLLTIDVEGAPDDAAAARLAREIANSPLVKTALAGEDPNWGRILAAAGKSGVAFDPTRVDIHLNGHQVCRRGARADFKEATVQATMQNAENHVLLKIRGWGRGTARFWTCDLTKEYIRINAEYRT